MSTALTIVHSPTGIDHPYEPIFEERRPRDPSAGDMTAIGFLTRPGNIAESVRVDWTRNGVAQAPIFARAIQRNDAEDRWLVEIGVVEADDNVAYVISSHDDAGRLQAASSTFGFKTRSWKTAARWRTSATADGKNLLVATDQFGHRGIAFTLEAGSVSGSVRLELVEAPPSNLEVEHVADGIYISDDSASLWLSRAYEGPLPFHLRWQVEGDAVTAIELTAPLAGDESLSGFGERFDALDQHGRAPDVAVYEQYKNQGNRTYLPAPFFLSSKGYGLLIEGSTRVNFDLGRSVPDRWRAVFDASSNTRPSFDWFVGAPVDIVRAFTAIAGRPEPLPLWAYGVWMSSNEWNTQARVEQEVAESARHEIPATVVVIEAWSDEATFYVWNGARYPVRSGAAAPTAAEFTYPAEGPWPNPQAMIDGLHAAGIRLVLWQIPALKALNEPHEQHARDIEHALVQSLVIQNEDGSPYRNPFFWFKDAHIPDFTNSETIDWWMSKRRYLLDEIGVDGFKTDGGEHLAGRGLRASNGMRGSELVNAFPDLYVGAYHRFAKERRQCDALTFSRAGHTRAGSFPAHWAGDENSTWEAFRRSIVAGLTAGLCGVTFWGWDIAGFSDALPSAELYLRATAMATFCPIMQYHSEWNPPGMPSRDRTPWNIAEKTGDARAIDLFRQFANLRMNLLPYIAREARAAAADGTPLMRSLALDFPDDHAAWNIEDQYLFGRDLLIAPFVHEGENSRSVHLPTGEWVDFWSGESHHGPITLSVTMDLDRIPVFARGGAAIPLRLGPNRRLFEPTGNGTSLTDGLVIAIAGAATASATWLDENQRPITSSIRSDESGGFSAGADSVAVVPLGLLAFHPVE